MTAGDRASADAHRFGCLLRQQRLSARLTQEELAELAGISPRAIWDLESGRTRRPRRSTVNLLAGALGLGDRLAEEFGRAARPRAIRSAADEIRSPADAQGHTAADAQGHTAAPPNPVITPAQLPHDLAGFVGRRAELDRLNDLAASRGRGRSGMSLPIIAVTGPAGIGKTALAVRWAHQMAAQFDGGQLYIDLNGFSEDQTPMPPGDALGQLLRGLGADSMRTPSALDESAGMYRSLLAGRRVLVLLDNAASVAQVRPLLPGSASCLALITSRKRLSGLAARDGARRISLGPLTTGESVTVLAQTVGQDRVEAEAEAAAELAGACDHWPLALRVAGEHVADRPCVTLADMVADLAEEPARLDMLAADHDTATAVRGALSCSYQALEPDAARTFRLLGLHGGPDISVPAAAALTGTTSARAARLLDAIADIHLLDETAKDRYQLGDLVHLYAGELARSEESAAACDGAVGRIAAWYLRCARAADRALIPARARPSRGRTDHGHPALDFQGHDQALEWCEAERRNLIAVVEMAAAHHRHDIAWKLAATLRDFCAVHNHVADWITTHRIGVASAHRAGDRFGQAWLLHHLSNAYWRAGRPADAVGACQQALRLWRQLGQSRYETGALNNLGCIYGSLHEMGRPGGARACLVRALTGTLQVPAPMGYRCLSERS